MIFLLVFCNSFNCLLSFDAGFFLDIPGYTGSPLRFFDIPDLSRLLSFRVSDGSYRVCVRDLVLEDRRLTWIISRCLHDRSFSSSYAGIAVYSALL